MSWLANLVSPELGTAQPQLVNGVVLSKPRARMEMVTAWEYTCMQAISLSGEFLFFFVCPPHCVVKIKGEIVNEDSG